MLPSTPSYLMIHVNILRSLRVLMKKNRVCELNHMRFDEELKAEACGWTISGKQIFSRFNH